MQGRSSVWHSCRSLSLATNASITDVSLLVLSKLLALTSLNLAGCRITGNGIQTLHKLTVRPCSPLSHPLSLHESS